MTNPLHEGGLDSSQKPIYSWNNPYFASGVLKPKPINDATTTTDTARFRSRRTETLVLLGQRPLSEVTDQPDSSVDSQAARPAEPAPNTTVRKSSTLGDSLYAAVPSRASRTQATESGPMLPRRSTTGEAPRTTLPQRLPLASRHG